MQAATTHSNKFQIADASPPAGEWNGYTAASSTVTLGGTNPPFGGGPQISYTPESGLLSSGVTAPIQTGPTGNMIRFNIFANNCWTQDFCQIGGVGGSQRTEFDGAGTAQFGNNTAYWISYSDCIEPATPITSNWFITGQVHQTINGSGGASPPFLITGKIGSYRAIQFANTGTGGTFLNAYEWPVVRGKWENMVIEMIMDPTGSTGIIKLWKNGVLVVNYSGITGVTPVSGTENYYWKFGLYESQVPEYQSVRYANMTAGTSSLVAKITSPDAIPSGYGTTCQ
jgi:hypothetical protein